MKLFQLSTVFAAALIATAASAAPASTSADRALTQRVSQGTILARETEAGDDRGGHGKGHRLSDESATQVARETEAGDDRGGHGRKGRA